MTFTLTLTADWLVYAYMLLEQLIFIYVQELKGRNINAYFDRLAAIEVIDCQQTEFNCSKEVPTQMVAKFSEPEVLEIKPIQTELDDQANNLWNELQIELESMEDEVPYFIENEFVSLKDYSEEETDDCIHLADLEEEATLVQTGFEKFASAKIADEMDGPQQWVVSVIGIEEEYIHVSDGKRIWINVGKEALKIRNKDVLTLDVYRKGKQVEVERLFLLEAGSDMDYIIPDELHHIFTEEKMAI